MARELNRSFGMFLRQLGGGGVFQIIAPVYRRIFISINLFVKMTIPKGFAGSLLDLGGGDGAVLNKLLNSTTPNLVYFVDPTPNAGLMITNPGVFKKNGFYLHEVDEIKNLKFDLILLVDVLHHVEPVMRNALLIQALDRLSATGSLLIKEVEPKGFRSKLTFWADVYISRDPVVFFVSLENLTKLIHEIDPKLVVFSHKKYNKRDFPNYAISVSY